MEILWDKDTQMEVLERSFNENLRFWEKELKVSSDFDREPFLNAIAEIPHTHPYICRNAPVFDKDIREEFVKSRYMDCYGKNWRNYYKP